MNQSTSKNNRKHAKQTIKQSPNPSNPSQRNKDDTITNNNKKKTYDEKPINWPSWIQAIATIVIVFVTGYYTYYAREQVREMRSSIQTAERAWMGIASISGTPTIGKKLTVDLTFRNVGKSPARNVTIVTTGQDVHQNSHPNFTGLRDTVPESKGIAAPQAEIHSFTTRKKSVDEEALKAIRNGTVQSYVYGIIEYDDIFDKHHWMTYCYSLVPASMQYQAYKEHNDTDSYTNK